MTLCTAKLNKNSSQAQTGHRPEGKEMQASRSLPHLRDLTQHLNWELSKTPEVEKRGPQRVNDGTSPSAGELKELPRLEGMFLLSA